MWCWLGSPIPSNPVLTGEADAWARKAVPCPLEISVSSPGACIEQMWERDQCINLKALEPEGKMKTSFPNLLLLSQGEGCSHTHVLCMAVGELLQASALGTGSTATPARPRGVPQPGAALDRFAVQAVPAAGLTGSICQPPRHGPHHAA